MTGTLSIGGSDDVQQAAVLGEEESSSFRFTLTVVSDDLESMLSDPLHRARLFGTVEAPALSSESITVNDGRFGLFVADTETVGTRRMNYTMKLLTQEGKHYFLSGHKRVHDDPGIDSWSDTSTLSITVHHGDDEGGDIFGRGVLRIRPADFARQLTTMQVSGAPNVAARLALLAKFGRFFAGTLFDTYGGVLAKQNRFDPEAPPRKKRPLEAPLPEVHPLRTEDGVGLRLTRYQGGSKGPVVLAHGLGVSSRIFSLDTVEPNLVEYLAAHGYDVWLLDYRTSIELPASEGLCSGDDIARYDFPAAVAAVREISGADTVQVVAHCFGSTAFTKAMLGGWLTGVRSAVCSQVSAHLNAPLRTRVKAGLHLPGLLRALGADSLTAYTDRDANWSDRFFDDMLRLYPIQAEERCNSPICHRITFLYGMLFEHDQLNAATHDSLHELFGVANIASLDHLTKMVRRRAVVTGDGVDAYLPHADRMAIPITFISGAENACFLPKSTERTYTLLGERNGEHLYQRHVIPHYGHIDCIFGKDAAEDVYPHILRQLEES